MKSESETSQSNDVWFDVGMGGMSGYLDLQISQTSGDETYTPGTDEGQRTRLKGTRGKRNAVRKFECPREAVTRDGFDGAFLLGR